MYLIKRTCKYYYVLKKYMYLRKIITVILLSSYAFYFILLIFKNIFNIILKRLHSQDSFMN